LRPRWILYSRSAGSRFRILQRALIIPLWCERSGSGKTVRSIRTLRLDDRDLANRRLTIAGRARPLDELTHRVLLAWHHHCRRRSPNTANPHLLISFRTAVGRGPVSAPWTNLILRGLPGTLERQRIDRQLEVALTHRADPLHLAAVLDLDESTAIRYAVAARQLLERAHEADPATSLPTQRSLGNAQPPAPSGSC
jgi:hypothetical protein